MKLRILRALMLAMAVLIVVLQIVHNAASNAYSLNPWIILVELVCAGIFYLCYQAYRCPHCKNQLKITDTKKCPHCEESLDV